MTSQLVKLDFAPGFHRESTQYSEEGKWYDGNRVRFREGKPENLRGYQKFSDTDINGLARDIITWTDNNSRPYIALGTNQQLYVIQNQTFYDSTPVTFSVSVSGNFETFTATGQAATVEVSINGMPTVEVGQRVEFLGVDAFSGVTVSGTRTIVAVSGTSHFTVSTTNNVSATAAASNQGSAGSINILIPPQSTDDIQGLGWGAGTYQTGEIGSTTVSIGDLLVNTVTKATNQIRIAVVTATRDLVATSVTGILINSTDDTNINGPYTVAQVSSHTVSLSGSDIDVIRFTVSTTEDVGSAVVGVGGTITLLNGQSTDRAWNEPATESAITFLANQWSLDTWGEDLMALRRGDRIVYMDNDTSVIPTRAVEISAAPLANTFLVSPNDRHVICYGSEPFSVSGIDNMTVRWSSQEDFEQWSPIPVSSNSGEVILTEGSRIIGATRSRNAINIWTDKAMYTQQFIGPPFTFSFTQVGSNCGLIGPHASIDYDGISYWMGQNNFFAFDGRVQTMPCTIRRKLFEDFNTTNQEKVYAGINSEFKEIIWLYPLAASPEPNAYVIYNTQERTWVYGKLFEDGIVTTFQDRNVYNNTLMTGRTSETGDVYIWDNEPENIYRGDGVQLTSFLESAEFDLDTGKQLMFIDKLIPDYSFDSGEQVNFFVNVKDYPNGTVQEKGPFVFNQNITKVNLRARGRSATVKVSGTNDGSWRWGSVRMSMQPDGER